MSQEAIGIIPRDAKIKVQLKNTCFFVTVATIPALKTDISFIRRAAAKMTHYLSLVVTANKCRYATTVDKKQKKKYINK